jgi:hypothetical protein
LTSTRIFPLLVALLGQAPPAPSLENPGEPAVRLEFMKQSLAIYEIHPIDDHKITFLLQAEPIMRFTNPVGNSRDGAIFLWLDTSDRPWAAAQVFLRRDGLWFHELTSLAPGRLVATSRVGPDWTPARAGVEFQPIPDAPKPAETAERRVVQLRTLASGFSASDFFQNTSWQQLRLLPKPLVRYGRPDREPIDGALFCFVLTTDPEVFLMVEARMSKQGPEWQYAFAPMTTYAVKASWKGQEVWSLPYRRIQRTENDAFHVRPYQALE